MWPGKTTHGLLHQVISHCLEEIKLVLDERPADGSSELIPLEIVTSGRKGVARIEHAIAEELEQIPMNVVCAGFCHCVDCGSGMVPILRRQRAGLDFEFLERIGKGQRQIQVVIRIVVRCAIEQVRHAVRQTAGNDNFSRRIIPNARIQSGAGARSSHPA